LLGETDSLWISPYPWYLHPMYWCTNSCRKSASGGECFLGVCVVLEHHCSMLEATLKRSAEPQCPKVCGLGLGSRL